MIYMYYNPVLYQETKNEIFYDLLINRINQIR